MNTAHTIAWGHFFAVSALVLLMPGPTVFAVIFHTTQQGLKALAPFVAAVCLGYLFQLTLVIVCMAWVGILQPEQLFALRLTGALFLIYLGVRCVFVRGAYPQAALLPAIGVGDAWAISAFNPTNAVLFATVFPTLLDPLGSVTGQMAFMGGAYMAMAIVNLCMYAGITWVLIKPVPGALPSGPRLRLMGKARKGMGIVIGLLGTNMLISALLG